VLTEPLLRCVLPRRSTAARHGRHRNQSLLYYCVLDRVYRAVAWQSVDQIPYNTYVFYLNIPLRYLSTCYMPNAVLQIEHLVVRWLESHLSLFRCAFTCFGRKGANDGYTECPWRNLP
jgi:uncharacterized protein (DUF1919 family)